VTEAPTSLPGADEIQRGKGQHYWTVLSDLVRGKVIGLARDRTQEALAGLLRDKVDVRQGAAVEAVCIDMHRGYRNAVAAELPRAAFVLGKFHVLQLASNALDVVRRQGFFHAGDVMREYGRGKRWLLLRRWRNPRRSERAELEEHFAVNRRLFKAYVLREQLEQLWKYGTPRGVANFLWGWVKALRRLQLPETMRTAI
jgi:transposase